MKNVAKNIVFLSTLSLVLVGCAQKFEAQAVVHCGGPKICNGGEDDALHCTLIDALAESPRRAGEAGCQNLQKQLDKVMSCYQSQGQCVARGSRAQVEAPACQVLIDDLQIQGCSALPFKAMLAMAVNKIEGEKSLDMPTGAVAKRSVGSGARP